MYLKWCAKRQEILLEHTQKGAPKETGKASLAYPKRCAKRQEILLEYTQKGAQRERENFLSIPKRVRKEKG